MDPLDRLLELAGAEGAWSAAGFAAFADGLRERARLVLEERVTPLEQRIRALEDEVAALEREVAWRQETMAGLEHEREDLKAEARALQAGWDAAAASHEKLLAHHREVLARAVGLFKEAAALPFWKLRSGRRLLGDSAALFARELR